MQCVTVVSAPSRLTHDISLEEFEDEDLSEITDECGISLHCKESLAARVGAWDRDRDGDIPCCARVWCWLWAARHWWPPAASDLGPSQGRRRLLGHRH